MFSELVNSWCLTLAEYVGSCAAGSHSPRVTSVQLLRRQPGVRRTLLCGPSLPGACCCFPVTRCSPFSLVSSPERGSAFPPFFPLSPQSPPPQQTVLRSPAHLRSPQLTAQYPVAAVTCLSFHGQTSPNCSSITKELL